MRLSQFLCSYTKHNQQINNKFILLQYICKKNSSRQHSSTHFSCFVCNFCICTTPIYLTSNQVWESDNNNNNNNNRTTKVKLLTLSEYIYRISIIFPLKQKQNRPILKENYKTAALRKQKKKKPTNTAKKTRHFYTPKVNTMDTFVARKEIFWRMLFTGWKKITKSEKKEQIQKTLRKNSDQNGKKKKYNNNKYRTSEKIIEKRNNVHNRNNSEKFK